MAGMGPPPKNPAQRARRNATFAMTTLPMEGRKGRAPAWPLIPDVVLTARRQMAADKVELLEYELTEAESMQKRAALERKLDVARERLAILEAQLREQRKLEALLWKDLWKLPQAVQWERLSWLRDVAQYVRFKVMAELGDMDSAKEARQWSDRLGLSPMSMLRLRWQIAEDETAPRRAARPATPATSTTKQPAGPDPYAALRAV